MKMIFVILKKECAALFKSPLFFMMSFLLTMMFAVTFSIALYNFINNSQNVMMSMGLAQPQQQNIHYMVFLQHLSFLNLMLIFITPALAMRLMAEEKKNRTFDLLLTSPITSTQIVIGKYLSIIAVVAGLTLIAMLYFIIARRIFEFPWGTTLTATFGLFLVGAVYSSVSLFAASLTDNTLISFFLGVVFNLGLWIVSGTSDLFDSGLGKAVFDQVSMNSHLQSMIEGVIRTQSLVYFISMIVVFGFLTERVVESARWRAS